MSLAPKKFKKNQGFTLVELLVTITIFVVLTGVVLVNQAKFNSSILLTNLAYDTALTIRQAQTYGINIKNFNIDDDKFVPYGVHFDVVNQPRSFILFADLDYDSSDPDSSTDVQYDGGGADSPDLSICQNVMGCVNRYNITRGNYIDSLCADDESNTGSCKGSASSVNSVDIVFERPDPDAKIRAVNDGASTSLTSIRIVLKNQGDDNSREIVVKSNGLMYIKPR